MRFRFIKDRNAGIKGVTGVAGVAGIQELPNG
jgi:hypothetical protein